LLRLLLRRVSCWRLRSNAVQALHAGRPAGSRQKQKWPGLHL
jgi:hypothetical protein